MIHEYRPDAEPILAVKFPEEEPWRAALDLAARAQDELGCDVKDYLSGSWSKASTGKSTFFKDMTTLQLKNAVLVTASRIEDQGYDVYLSSDEICVYTRPTRCEGGACCDRKLDVAATFVIEDAEKNEDLVQELRERLDDVVGSLRERGLRVAWTHTFPEATQPRGYP